MHNEKWEVRINSISMSLGAEIFIFRLCGDFVEYLQIDSPDVSILRVEKKEGNFALIKPLVVCPIDLAMDIAKGFIEYGNSQGFKNGSETFAKGKLEATEKHLADMRKLVFEEKVTVTGVPMQIHPHQEN